jgi:ECF sigma factor
MFLSVAGICRRRKSRLVRSLPVISLADTVDLMHKVTAILSTMEEGNPQAAAQLLPLVYDELRRLAAAQMANEAHGNTLNATALGKLRVLPG